MAIRYAFLCFLILSLFSLRTDAKDGEKKVGLIKMTSPTQIQLAMVDGHILRGNDIPNWIIQCSNMCYECYCDPYLKYDPYCYEYCSNPCGDYDWICPNPPPPPPPPPQPPQPPQPPVICPNLTCNQTCPACPPCNTNVSCNCQNDNSQQSLSGCFEAQFQTLCVGLNLCNIPNSVACQNCINQSRTFCSSIISISDGTVVNVNNTCPQVQCTFQGGNLTEYLGGENITNLCSNLVNTTELCAPLIDILQPNISQSVQLNGTTVTVSINGSTVSCNCSNQCNNTANGGGGDCPDVDELLEEIDMLEEQLNVTNCQLECYNLQSICFLQTFLEIDQGTSTCSPTCSSDSSVPDCLVCIQNILFGFTGCSNIAGQCYMACGGNIPV